MTGVLDDATAAIATLSADASASVEAKKATLDAVAKCFDDDDDGASIVSKDLALASASKKICALPPMAYGVARRARSGKRRRRSRDWGDEEDGAKDARVCRERRPRAGVPRGVGSEGKVASRAGGFARTRARRRRTSSRVISRPSCPWWRPW